MRARATASVTAHRRSCIPRFARSPSTASDVTGSESGTELAAMQGAVDAFRRAAETLAGRAPLTSARTIYAARSCPRARRTKRRASTSSA